jgi:Zn-dependent M28 family amino/carboxypeptidase
LFPIFLASFLASVSPGGDADRGPEISADRIKAHVAYLASDRLEGRGPGTRGEFLATEYIAAEFQKSGLKPIGERGTYFQPVPLVRVVTSPKATLRAVKGETTIDIPCEEGFSGTSQTQKELEEFDAEAVFVGHGITAPEFGWDDYRDTDVKGKVVVLFTNEPPSDDPKFFGGKAQTYYGRPTFKFEEAARRGARACFIIHTPATAGYPYSVVRPLDGAQLEREPGRPALAFAGWLSREAGEKLLGLSGRTVEGALKEADTKGFKPYPLGVRLKGNIPTRVEKIVSNNVAGLAEGSDPALRAEAVVFTAHWDHLGVGRAVLGDAIYNGAADNATGCALLMELARAWSAQPRRPKRSALFLAVTAEEKGLLGSKYYTQNPLVPPGKTALDLNFDMILPLGVPESVVVNGAERTTAWPAVRAAAKKSGLEIEPDPRAHLGVFYRSDHFSFARAGVPAFSVATGLKVRGKPRDFASKAMKDFNDRAYHSPQDELRPEWDFSGFVVLARFALDVARDVADADRLPTWNPGDEFRPARDKLGLHQAEDADQEKKAIKTLLDDQVTSWNKGDLPGFMKGYWESEQLTFFSGRTRTSGWKSTLERYRIKYQGEGKEMGRLSFEELSIDLLGPEHALVRGRFRLQIKDARPTGLFTLILRRTRSGWRIIHDHTSS